MSQQTATHSGTVRHRAEDDLFHVDRSRAPRSTECETGLFSSRSCARYWIIGMRPRWLQGRSQPLLRPRCED
jgi:hypothetical protein